MRKKTNIRSLVALLGVMLAWAPEARADILLAQTYTGALIYGGATYAADFNGVDTAGGTTFTFDTFVPNTRVLIIFNAECAVNGDTTNYVDIDIRLDPAGSAGEFSVAPSNGDNAFCSGNGTTTGGGGFFPLDGWVSASTVATAVLSTPGTHSIWVRVNGAASGATRLDDMSLIVSD
jgi:hypothetical protein